MILAFDPGAERTGYAIVKPGSGPRVSYVSSGEFENTLAAFWQVLVEAPRNDGLLVAIERPAGFIHDPFRGPTLLETAFFAGGMAMLAQHHGVEVFAIPATTVRQMLVGKSRLGKGSERGDMDRLVKAAVGGIVDDMPKRSNVHVRDALAIAIVARWMQLSKKKAA